MKLQKIKRYNKYNIQNSRIIKALKVPREKLNQTIKKAQIINKILNKILINASLFYNIFSILAIKKRGMTTSLFFDRYKPIYSAAIFAAIAASLAAFALFLRLT